MITQQELLLILFIFLLMLIIGIIAFWAGYSCGKNSVIPYRHKRPGVHRIFTEHLMRDKKK